MVRSCLIVECWPWCDPYVVSGQDTYTLNATAFCEAK